MKKAQIPVIFIFIFAIIVAGLLLTWGVSVIFKMQDLPDLAIYKKTITKLESETAKMNVYETRSTKIIQIQTPKAIKQFCFTNRDLNLNIKDEGFKYIIENSDFNTFMLPLDAFEKTAFTIPNLRGKTNPECIEVKNNILKAKLTTFDNFVQIESA